MIEATTEIDHCTFFFARRHHTQTLLSFLREAASRRPSTDNGPLRRARAGAGIRAECGTEPPKPSSCTMWRGRKDFEDFSALDTLPFSFRFRLELAVEVLRMWLVGLGVPSSGEVTGPDGSDDSWVEEVGVPAGISPPGPIELSRDVTLNFEDPGNL